MANGRKAGREGSDGGKRLRIEFGKRKKTDACDLWDRFSPLDSGLLSIQQEPWKEHLSVNSWLGVYGVA